MGMGAGRGRKGGPTGRRQFSSVEDMKSGNVTDPKWKLRRNRDEEEDEDEHEEEEEEEEEEDDEDDGKEQKSKGVSGLIEVHNPNAPVKNAVKASSVDVNTAAPTELSRREREELEKQRARERYLKLQAEGKTEQAQKDLARLEIIRKQREEAAKKREEERLAKDAKKKDARK